ncbi:MAG: hypothetical protein J7484_14735, partial [Microbacterium sp.]|nr:hypothetical protein [Microbacterium sp.]
TTVEVGTPIITFVTDAAPAPAAAAAPTHAEGARPEPDGGASPAVLASWRMMLRPRWKSAAAASALLLGVGVGIGWAAFAPHPQAFPLSTDEVHRQLALSEKGGYDAGSVRPAARDGDALVWFATKTAQNLDCIILDVGEQSSANCVPADEGDLFQLSASVFIRDSDDTSGGGTSVSAYGMTATNGERLVSVQRWNPNESMLAQFEGDERVRAEALIADGYFPGLSLLGEFRGSPVWYAQRDGQAGWIDACVIVDATGDVSCRAEDGADDKEYTVEGADPQGAPWSVQVRLTRWGAPYLTITEGPTAARTVVIDTKSGDPIEVTTPLSDPDG